VNVIDGYTSVQAVRRSLGRGHEHTPKPPPEQAPAPIHQEKPGQADKLRIGHTSEPLKRTLVCYGCEYKFLLTGKFSRTYCPKCRQELDLTDHVIESEFDGTLKTLGRVEIRPGAVLNEARIVAGDAVLLGDALSADIQACRTIELCHGARFDLSRLRSPTIIIGRGSRIAADVPVKCENLEVEGDLKARVYSSGIVTVHSGGLLRGELHGSHLHVEEGAGLVARLFVSSVAEMETGRHAAMARK
jgi:cytoskeletal protein CcmA (bactofilin family)